MYSKKEILNYLSENKENFRSNYNIVKIGLFGSYARDEQKADSDIDILVVFDEKAEDLFSKRLKLMGIIKSKFNLNVDICHEQAIKPFFRDLILSEAIYA
jgi:uncharacterized protein